MPEKQEITGDCYRDYAVEGRFRGHIFIILAWEGR
jgi:hypothetical protein